MGGEGVWNGGGGEGGGEAEDRDGSCGLLPCSRSRRYAQHIGFLTFASKPGLDELERDFYEAGGTKL